MGKSCIKKACTPVIKTQNVYISKPAPTCSKSPYNITDITSYNTYKDYIANPPPIDFKNQASWLKYYYWYIAKLDTPINYDFWYSCIQNKIYSDDLTILNNDISGINTQINDYNTQTYLNDTYNQMNNSSLYYYKNDLTYVICKISFFIILIITYIYFFKLKGIIEPIKKLFNIIMTNGTQFINKATENIKKIKPTDAGLKNAGLKNAGLKNAGLKNAGLKDAGLKNTGLKNAGLTPTNIKIKSTNASLKLKN